VAAGHLAAVAAEEDNNHIQYYEKKHINDRHV